MYTLQLQFFPPEVLYYDILISGHSLVIFLVGFSGLQEYVEAVSFQHFIKTRSLISMDEINKQLIFSTEENGKENKTVRI